MLLRISNSFESIFRSFVRHVTWNQRGMKTLQAERYQIISCWQSEKDSNVCTFVFGVRCENAPNWNTSHSFCFFIFVNWATGTSARWLPKARWLKTENLLCVFDCCLLACSAYLPWNWKSQSDIQPTRGTIDRYRQRRMESVPAPILQWKAIKP